MSARDRPRGPTPRDEAELLDRARALENVPIARIAALLGEPPPSTSARTKGKAGELLERALGATGGSAATHDFPELSIELKTVPLDPSGRPRESTFVCTLPLASADRARWSDSWARKKLSAVLWVPLVDAPRSPENEADPASPRVGRAVLWRPTPEQEAVLAADFDEIVGLIGSGAIEALSARVGRWLQARPKAAHGGVRTAAFGPDDERIFALPRGFYLRARFTGAILRDPSALPR